MRFSTIVASASALLASTVLADGFFTYDVSQVGKATVINNCGRQVFMQTAFNGTADNFAPIEDGQTKSDALLYWPGVGASIKLGFDATNPQYIMQFEYTVDLSNSMYNSYPSVFYDISLVNGAPFQNYGIELKPSHEECPTSTCPAGGQCPVDQAYSEWNNDLSSKKCNYRSDLTMTLCSVSKPVAEGAVPEGGPAHLGPVTVRSLAERALNAAKDAVKIETRHSSHAAFHARRRRSQSAF